MTIVCENKHGKHSFLKSSIMFFSHSLKAQFLGNLITNWYLAIYSSIQFLKATMCQATVCHATVSISPRDKQKSQSSQQYFTQTKSYFLCLSDLNFYKQRNAELGKHPTTLLFKLRTYGPKERYTFLNVGFPKM